MDVPLAVWNGLACRPGTGGANGVRGGGMASGVGGGRDGRGGRKRGTGPRGDMTTGTKGKGICCSADQDAIGISGTSVTLPACDTTAMLSFHCDLSSLSYSICRAASGGGTAFMGFRTHGSSPVKLDDVRLSSGLPGSVASTDGSRCSGTCPAAADGCGGAGGSVGASLSGVCVGLSRRPVCSFGGTARKVCWVGEGESGFSGTSTLSVSVARSRDGCSSVGESESTTTWCAVCRRALRCLLPRRTKE
mmetsp:Transcript_7002/g.20275  ORF Transcript_7002/g.20275 Transcript_7002/m.20275 type:complete len:248 (-) Transcript_7002:324-1067(-)